MRHENCTIDHASKPKELVGRHGTVPIERIMFVDREDSDGVLFIHSPENPDFTGYYARVQCVAYANTPFEAVHGPFKSEKALEDGGW